MAVKIKDSKKGIYFTIDSVIAGGIVLITILLASSFYVEEKPSIHLSYLSQDLIKILSTLNVKEINNEYLNERISNGDITNLDNTVLEQIGEFWAKNTDNGREMANKSFSNVTEPFVSNITGFGLWIDNEAIYKRDMPVKKTLISTKKIISGIKKGETAGETRKNPPALWLVVAEVRIWE